MSRYKKLYRDRRQFGLRVCHDTTSCIVTGKGLMAGECVTIQPLYLERGAEARPLGCVATQGHNTTVQAHDIGPRYGAWPTTRSATGPAIRRRGSHDTKPNARCVCGLGAVRAQWACSLVCWVCTCAPNPVLDLVHYFSHCLDHCS